jgi:glyoxylase-like metal-dependent hydrolase (beta-lactamase superfamily II)
MTNTASADQRRSLLKQKLGQARSSGAVPPARPAGPLVPPPGVTVPVAPGVFWLRIPMPVLFDHINIWLLDDGDGWVLVDTGPKGDRIDDLWDAITRLVLRGKPVRRVIATHHHPDHFGMAGRLTERWGAEFLMTGREWRLIQTMANGDPLDAMMLWQRFLDMTGITDPIEVFGSADRLAWVNSELAPLPAACTTLKGGATLTIGGKIWTVLTGGGHALEHGCLYRAEDGVLIGGDHIMPDALPTLAVALTRPHSDTVSEYQKTLDGLLTLPDGGLVLPAHGMPFKTLHDYVRQTRVRLDSRLDGIVAACAEPVGITDLMLKTSGEWETAQAMLMVSDMLGLLNHLVAKGRIRTVMIGDPPRRRFVRAE